MCVSARLANGISIEFKIRPTFWVLQFKMCSTAHNKILHITLSWRVQKFIVIGTAHFKSELCKFRSKFKVDRNIVNGTDARSRINKWRHDMETLST